MKCPHCGTDFHPNFIGTALNLPNFIGNPLDEHGPLAVPEIWSVHATACTKCRGLIIDLIREYKGNAGWQKASPITVFPHGSNRGPTPQQVPPEIKEDYEEACAALPISAKASAALARRCVQAILNAQGYTQHNLVDQITAVLNETDASKSLPSHLYDQIDAVRNFGNFGAHPITDLTTLQVIPVEVGEAEWCLEVVEAMFDHFYVKPAQVAAKKAALNAKLASAGKKPAK